MDNETLFYIFGGVAAVSAVLVTFLGLKLKNFPGRMLPLVIVWFAAFAIGASTFSVLQAKDHEAHEAHELEKAGEEIEHGSSGPFENEAGALGGEREELEEEAEKEAEGSQEEEPVGPIEGSQEGDEGEQGSSPGSEGASSDAEASTTLKLAADPVEIAFDKAELSAKAGRVTIDFDNPAAIPHNVVIEKDGEELAGFEPITEAEESVSADLQAGSYQFVCTVPGHEEAGMVGTLTVE
jgi:plastocyanin